MPPTRSGAVFPDKTYKYFCMNIHSKGYRDHISVISH